MSELLLLLTLKICQKIKVSEFQVQKKELSDQYWLSEPWVNKTGWDARFDARSFRARFALEAFRCLNHVQRSFQMGKNLLRKSTRLKIRGNRIRVSFHLDTIRAGLGTAQREWYLSYCSRYHSPWAVIQREWYLSGTIRGFDSQNGS